MFEPLPQHRPRPMQAGANGADGATQNLRRLFVTEPFHVHQNDGSTKFGRQIVQRLLSVPPELPTHRHRFEVGIFVGDVPTAFTLVIFFGRRVVQRNPVYSVRLPLSVQKGVGHDGGDPSDEAIFRLEAVKGAPRLRQRFRQQILSVVTITRQSVSDAVER
jgi:hypothetical protein